MKLEIHIHNYNHGGIGETRILAAISQLKELIQTMSQATIDQLTAQIETAKATIVEKVAAESQQVKDFIAAHPELDTTALESAVAGLGSLSDSVSGIFPDAPTPDPEPEPEPEPEPVPEPEV